MEFPDHDSIGAQIQKGNLSSTGELILNKKNFVAENTPKLQKSTAWPAIHNNGVK